MKGEIVVVRTDDGLELFGLLCRPEMRTSPKDRFAKRAVLHVHGLAGNFYENHFLHDLAYNFNASGIAFYSFSNRGAGIVSEFRKQSLDGWVNVTIGGAHESFSECLLDIDACINLLVSRGYTDVILQGHSIGCHKVVFYQSQKRNPNVRAIALISPPDVWGFQKKEFNARHTKNLLHARKLIQDGRGKDFMPPDAYLIPVDGNAFLEMFSPESPLQMFSFYDENHTFAFLENISVPIFACYGSNFEPIVNEPNECLSIIRERAINCPKCQTNLISGAAHQYLGFENLLSNAIINWAKDVFGSS